MNKTKRKIYTSENYKSSNGMLTYVWGPPLWHVLHTISFNYPITPSNSEKKQYMSFITGLRNVLPCKYCRINFAKNLKKRPINIQTMESRDTFSRYVYQLHEDINSMLNKTSGLSYEMVRDRYENFRARCLLSPTDTPVTKIEEKGCTEPLVGKKSKCVLSIVPIDDPTPPFIINPQCIPKRKGCSRNRTIKKL